MNCRELEARLEALLDGELGEQERRRCERHFGECPTCRELVAPLEAAGEPPADLVGSVLARTSGPVCERAGALLCERRDGALAAAERELLAHHLESCTDCRALAAVLGQLAVDLPRLAELTPGPGFVDQVLAATLPPSVRLQRWWSGTWPRWVRRPRFASETAFIATLVLLLVVAMPGSPLEAVPAQAIELARTDPATRLERPVAALEERFTTRVEEPLRSRYARIETALGGWMERAGARARAAAGALASWAGTSRDRIASLLMRADREPSSVDEPASESENTTQEQP